MDPALSIGNGTHLQGEQVMTSKASSYFTNGAVLIRGLTCYRDQLKQFVPTTLLR